MYSDEEFERFLDENFPHWNSKMITPGFEFDQEPLRKVEGPLAPAARNLSQDDLQRTGFLQTKTKRGKTVTYSLKDWTSSAYSQKGLSVTRDSSVSICSISLYFIYSGELDAFQLAVRSFCNEVSTIQCNVKKGQFLNLVPQTVEDFEFDLMVALKVRIIDTDK